MCVYIWPQEHAHRKLRSRHTHTQTHMAFCTGHLRLTHLRVMEAFLKLYDQRRALAEVDETILSVPHEELDIAEDQPVELSQGTTQPSLPADDSSQAHLICETWMPRSMSQIFGPNKDRSWNFRVDAEVLPAGLAAQMDSLRDSIDDIFSWKGKKLSQEWRRKRGAAQVGSGFTLVGLRNNSKIF